MTYEKEIARLHAAIEDADAVVVGAGAGLSTAASFTIEPVHIWPIRHFNSPFVGIQTISTAASNEASFVCNG